MEYRGLHISNNNYVVVYTIDIGIILYTHSHFYWKVPCEEANKSKEKDWSKREVGCDNALLMLKGARKQECRLIKKKVSAFKVM